jgi:hypothetical protein
VKAVNHKFFEGVQIDFGDKQAVEDRYVLNHLSTKHIRRYEIRIDRFVIYSQDDDEKIIGLHGIKDFEKKIRHHYKFEKIKGFKFYITEINNKLFKYRIEYKILQWDKVPFRKGFEGHIYIFCNQITT